MSLRELCAVAYVDMHGADEEFFARNAQVEAFLDTPEPSLADGLLAASGVAERDQRAEEREARRAFAAGMGAD